MDEIKEYAATIRKTLSNLKESTNPATRYLYEVSKLTLIGMTVGLVAFKKKSNIIYPALLGFGFGAARYYNYFIPIKHTLFRKQQSANN